VLPHVTGFCAKDCGAQNGEVMIRFGRGKVNFQPLFAALRDAGFAGPVFVETAGGKTFAQVTAVAQRNREYIETTISTLSA
jgi:sugar phosphate isomerase/epimerase